MKKLLNRLRRNAGPLFCMLVSREEALNLARHERKQPQRCGLSCGARTMLSVLPLIARPQALKTQPQLSVFPLIARPQALKTQSHNVSIPLPSQSQDRSLNMQVYMVRWTTKCSDRGDVVVVLVDDDGGGGDGCDDGDDDEDETYFSQ